MDCVAISSSVYADVIPLTVRKIAIVNEVFIALLISKSRVGLLSRRNLVRRRVGLWEISTCRHVAFFAVFIDVEPLPLDLRRNPQADYSSHERANEGASHDGQRDRDHDCF